jgi:hypothetical protein
MDGCGVFSGWQREREIDLCIWRAALQVQVVGLRRGDEMRCRPAGLSELVITSCSPADLPQGRREREIEEGLVVSMPA